MNKHNEQLMNGNHEQLVVLTDLVTLLIPGKATAGKFALWEDIVPPLAGPPPHSHPDEEFFYVISGSFEFILNDPSQPIKAGAGAFLHIPGYALHTYRNVGSMAGKLLTIATPGQLEDYFRAVGKPVRSAQDIPNLDEVPDFPNLDVTDFLALAPQHGVTFHIPQLAP